MRNATSLGVRCAASALAGILLASCGNTGGDGKNNLPTVYPGPLKVRFVNSERRVGWERNSPIEFTFSAPLSKESLKPGVIDKAIQIGIVTASGRIPAVGSFSFVVEHNPGNVVERRDKVVFDPTRTKASGDLGCADNPNGFKPLATYVITVPTSATSKKYLTSTAGDGILEPFESYFTTGERYIKELTAPRYVGIDGQGSLGFNPPRKVNGEVPYNVNVTVVFDEAMDPVSFELGNTILMKNETLSVIQGAPVMVPGGFVSDTCGRTWTFVPSFSFGGGGYDIAMVVTSGLKDLAGNPLSNSQTIRFRTEVKPSIPTVQVLNESFDNTTKRDAANTTADWGVLTAGVLKGGLVTTTVTNVQLLPSQYVGALRTRVRDHPFAQEGSAGVGHDQWIYFQGSLGAANAVTGMGWGPSSNLIYSANYSAVRVTLGHTQSDSLATNMTNNFDVGLPVTVFDGGYLIPYHGGSIDPPCQTDLCAVGFWPFPAFSNFFEYNGKNNVIVDVNSNQGKTYQITRIFYGPATFPNTHTFTTTGGNTGTLLEPAVTDMQFTFKRRTTKAQSTFYDTGNDSPDYAAPILSPSVQSGGTDATIEFEGAKGILFPITGNPTNVIPDPTTYTGFVTNIQQLDDYRFIRFRVTFVANVTTGQVPFLNNIAIPFVF